MKLSHSLTTLVGEWVALHKTPDARISSQSSQEINKAVAEEKRQYSTKKKDVCRSRCASLSDKDNYVMEEPVVLRDSNGRRRKDRPTSLIEIIRKRISPHRKEVINEEDDVSEDYESPKPRSLSTSEMRARNISRISITMVN